ncbi:hypothetical protein ABEY44_06570 [Priestia megaterium]
MTRLYLHPLIEVGAGHFGFTILMVIASPMDFIILSVAFRWSILVVEPSPEFPHRSLAADCPIFSFFTPSRLSFPTTLWQEKLSGVSSNSPDYNR